MLYIKIFDDPFQREKKKTISIHKKFIWIDDKSYLFDIHMKIYICDIIF